MNTVNNSDKIFATVINHGVTIYRTTIEGARSFEEIIRTVSHSLRGIAAGIVTIVLRNSTQGWALRRSLRIRPYMPVVSSEAVQLTLF